MDTPRICFVLFNLKILYCYVNTIVREVETSHMLSVIASIALEEKEQLVVYVAAIPLCGIFVGIML